MAKNRAKVEFFLVSIKVWIYRGFGWMINLFKEMEENKFTLSVLRIIWKEVYILG